MILGQTVERRVRAIAKKNLRLGLILQKKISDCIFDASMELVENEVSLMHRLSRSVNY